MPGCCDDCCATNPEPKVDDRAWRRVLSIALAVNGGMFLAEIVSGLHSGSVSLQADAIDFLADAGNYAISLAVAGMVLQWRARAAVLKGASIALLGLLVLAATIWHALAGTVPAAGTMGIVAIVALVANVAVALMLYRFRSGDANRRSVWICSRNDAIGNLAVMAAALGVFGTGTGWPDLAVAVIMAALGLSGGWSVLSQARAELHSTAPHPGTQPIRVR